MHCRAIGGIGIQQIYRVLQCGLSFAWEPHDKGALGMARSQDPNSARSQFYFALDDIHNLDGNYAVFGKVIEGMDVVLSLEIGDKMTKVTIVE